MPSRLRQPNSGAVCPHAKTSATLLIIDDDEVVRASLAAYLEDSGFSVLQASNGQQGLQVFERDKPDLVICDLRMPQMGGLELIRQVTDLAPQTPVIVVSGAGVMNDAVEALRLGAADYLIKPWKTWPCWSTRCAAPWTVHACSWKTSATAKSSRPPTANSKPA